MTAETKCTS